MGYPLAPNQQDLTPLQSKFLVEVFLLEKEEEIEAQRRADEDRDGGNPLPVRSRDARRPHGAAEGHSASAPRKPSGKSHPVNKPIKGKSLSQLVRERKGKQYGKPVPKVKWKKRK